MRIGIIVCGLVVSSGCGTLWNQERSRVPVAPSAGSGNTDLVFVRTGDRAYYYIVDKRRELCFFHSTLYGKKHLVELPCSKLPEYDQIMRDAGVRPRRSPSHARAEKPRSRPAPVYSPRPRARRSHPPPPPAASAPVPLVIADPEPPPRAAREGLTDEDRNGFRRAWVQRFCSRRAGRDESLDVLLTRHGLDADRWEAAKREFSADRDLWSALTSEAMDTCP